MGRSWDYEKPKQKESIMLNKVMIIGRLGKDPELKYTPSSMAVCNFSVATTEKYKDKSGVMQENTEWHNIVVWGKLAELCNSYLSKGRQAYIEGQLKTRSWDGKDGQKKYITEINAKEVKFLGGEAGGVTTKTSQQEPTPDFSVDDIPF